MGKIKLLWTLNIFKTLVINFRYFTIMEAIRFPVLVFRNIEFRKLKGNILLQCPIRTGLVCLGESSIGIVDAKKPTILDIEGSLLIQGKINIGQGSSISIGLGSSITFGENFRITGNSAIVSGGKKAIIFGSNCLLSWDILIMNTDFHSIVDANTNEILNGASSVIIGNNVWIGCQTTILKGVKIPNNSIISARALITRSFEVENTIIGGINGKILKSDVNWYH